MNSSDRIKLGQTLKDPSHNARVGLRSVEWNGLGDLEPLMHHIDDRIRAKDSLHRIQFMVVW